MGRPLELQLGFWVAADGRRKGKKFHSFPRRKTLPDVCTTKKMRLYVCFPYNNVCTFFAKKTFIIKLFGFFDGAQYLSCKPAGHSFLSSSFLPVPAGEGEEEEEVYCKVELPFKYPRLVQIAGEKKLGWFCGKSPRNLSRAQICWHFYRHLTSIRFFLAT